MKSFIIAIILAALVLPVFGQDANAPLYRTLDDSMGATISYGSSRLQDFDRDIGYNNQGKVYSTYKLRYDSLSKALQDSEAKLGRLIEFHDTAANIKTERDRYESILNQIQQVKSDYDNWYKTVQ